MLKFNANWRMYNIKKKISVTCPHPLCGELDLYSHAVVCPFMSTKLDSGDNDVVEDVRVFRFLYFLNKERIKFDRPILGP